MEFDKVMDILEYALPIIAALVGAKFVNRNSLPWHLWGGRLAKLVGLLVTVLDAARSPKRYIDDVVPDRIRKGVDKASAAKKFTTGAILLSLLGGCAGWQFTGKTWQETALINIANIDRVSGALQENGMPAIKQVCISLTELCRTDSSKCDSASACVDVANALYDLFDEIDFYLKQASIAVSLGDESTMEEKMEAVSKLIMAAVQKLGQYGAL